MDSRRFRLCTSTPKVLAWLVALGLTTTVACGGSGGDGRNDSGLDLAATNTLDLGSSEARVRSDLQPPAFDVQPIEATAEVTSGIDGPLAGLDGSATADLPVDQPLPSPEVGIDVVPGAEAGVSPDVGRGTGGAGGSTGISGFGGSGGTSGIGTGGTGTGMSLLSGWPSTSADTPHVFGPVSCSGAPRAAPDAYAFTLQNAGSTAVTFTGVSFSGNGYSVDLIAGASSINPGESRTVTITPPAIPFPLAPPVSYSAVLTLTTDEAIDNVHVIHLTQVVHGARLLWGSGAIASYLGGAAPGSTTTLSQDFTIANTGDEAATVDITSSDPNFVISPLAMGVEIPPGGSVVRTITIAPPAIQGIYTTFIGLAPSTNNLCAALPVQWTAYAMSIAGYPTFHPAGGTFPFSGACGSGELGSQKVEMTNVGTGVLKWVPVIVPEPGKAPCFEVIPSATPAPNPENWLSLDVGVQAEITVKPTILGADAREQCGNQRLIVQFSSADAGGAYAYESDNPAYNNSYNLEVTPLGDNLVISKTKLEFGVDNLLTSPPSTTAQVRTVDFSNRGWTDPLAKRDTTARVRLSITNPPAAPGDPPAYAFDPSGSIQETLIELPASPAGEPGPSTTVAIYYLRPERGPYTGTEDVGILHWQLDPGDDSCMCPAGATACPIRSGTISLAGRVVESKVSHGFTDAGYFTDFGTVFCGATANPRAYRLANVGDGNLTITSATFSSDLYFSFGTPPSLPATVPPGHEIALNIQPKTIRGADIDGPQDLGDLSNKFSATLTITTDTRNPSPGYPTIITVPLDMHANGIIIDPVASATWSYEQILWPASMISSLTVWVTNRGNVDAKASLFPAPPAVGASPFSMPDTDVPDGVLTPLSSSFGGEIFNRCDMATTSYAAPARLVLEAKDVDLAQRQQLGSSRGVCQDVVGAWTQQVTLAGQVSRTGSMCSPGQRCVPDSGRCFCDNSLASCGLIGCCTSVGVDGICVPYANQTPVRDTTGGSPGLTGCGVAGQQCAQCNDAQHAICSNAGVCTCAGEAKYCDNVCINTNIDVDNCGDCTSEGHNFACSMNHITRECHGGICDGVCNIGWDNCDQPQTKRQNGCDINLMTNKDHCGSCGRACADGQACSGGKCVCTPASCPEGCCTSQGTCLPFDAGQGLDACGSGGQLCAACVNQQECVRVEHGGQCKCNANTCGGCCYGNGVCMTGNSDNLCGKGGAACTDCAAANKVCRQYACVSECNVGTCPYGCCSNGVCRLGTADDLCGTGGGTCMNCTASDKVCISQQCYEIHL